MLYFNDLSTFLVSWNAEFVNSDFITFPSISESFAEGALKAHNKFRATHGSGPMTLDDKLSKAAEEYAKTLLDKGQLSHSKGLKDGENLAFKCTSSGKEMTGQEASLNW